MALTIVNDSNTIATVVDKINTISADLGSRDNLYNRSVDVVSALAEFNTHVDSDFSILEINRANTSDSITSITDSAVLATQNKLDSMANQVLSIDTRQMARHSYEIVSSGGVNTLSYNKKTGKISINFLSPFQVHNLVYLNLPFNLDGNLNDATRAIEIPIGPQGYIRTSNFKDNSLLPEDFYRTLGYTARLEVFTSEVNQDLFSPEAL